eukprot:Hpha_TRINITY_DN8785_c0_g1::TRINITY_DN8785_c0_g1_i1::g.45253::m.45253
MSGLLIFVQYTDRKVALELDPMATVSDMRQALIQSGLDAATNARLAHGEQELDDDSAMLADLGITSESTVEMSTGLVLKWISSSAHAVIEGDTLKHKTECGESCEQSCGTKAGAVLAPHEAFQGFTSGQITWKLLFHETKTNSSAGIGEKANLDMTKHFNSSGQGNGAFCWMWYAGGNLYHNGENTSLRAEGHSTNLRANTVVEFVLDFGKGTLTGSIDGKQLVEPLVKDVKGRCLLPYVELQTAEESVSIVR